MPFDVSLCILSWKARTTLRHTLASFRAGNILDQFQERLLFFNAIDTEDREIAAEFGFEALGSPSNVGIFGAVTGLAERAKSSYMLVVENDCPLDVTGGEFSAMLQRAIDDMKAHGVPVFLMRSRRNPGDPFWRRARYERKFRVMRPLGSTTSRPPSSPLRMLFEDWRYPTMKGCAIYAEEDPTVRHPGAIRKSANGNWLTTSKHLSWSNCCYLVKRDFLRDVVLARVKSHPSPVTLNGHQDIESAMKHARWWRRQEFPMGQSEPGPFTHVRLDR